MSAFKIDGSHATAVAVSAARKSFPFDGDGSSFIVEQDFQVDFASFTPLALNTAHATFTNAYLVKEGPLEALGGGVARFTRVYAQIPANRSEYESFAVTFPGFLDTTGANPPYGQYWVALGDGRDPVTKKVTSRLLHEYFLCASGQTYETPDAIPVNPKQVFTLDGNENSTVEYLTPESLLVADSNPTREEWEDLITSGAEFIAEDSDVRQWAGNIYERVTRYVVAK